MEKHSGASETRNTGAFNSTGDILFFIDADCILTRDTIKVVVDSQRGTGSDLIVGGTYSPKPFDRGFFNSFQAVFINYSETKHPENPDYVAAHAMAISPKTFRNSGGFREDFLPILEDVEYSHRLKRAGLKLVVVPALIVQHIFGFSLTGSLRNAVKKTFYWSLYSFKRGDLLADSGTASHELKINVSSLFCIALFLILYLSLGHSLFLYAVALPVFINTFLSWGLFKAFYRSEGILFAALSYIYYTTAFALAVGMGTLSGILRYLLIRR
jgi:GT2 family glycosyltransferase